MATNLGAVADQAEGERVSGGLGSAAAAPPTVTPMPAVSIVRRPIISGL
jgi:hypothetical protein